MTDATEAFWGDGGLADQMWALVKDAESEACEHREARRELNDVCTMWRERAEAAEAKLADAQAVSERRSRELKEYAQRAWAAEAALVEVEKLARRKGWWTDLAPSDLFARQAEIREGAIAEIADALAEHHCDECGHVGPASAWWADGTAECVRCAYVRPTRGGSGRV